MNNTTLIPQLSQEVKNKQNEIIIPAGTSPTNTLNNYNDDLFIVATLRLTKLATLKDRKRGHTYRSMIASMFTLNKHEVNFLFNQGKMASLLYELNRSNVNKLNIIFFDKDESYYNFYKESEFSKDFNLISGKMSIGNSLYLSQDHRNGNENFTFTYANINLLKNNDFIAEKCNSFQDIDTIYIFNKLTWSDIVNIFR